MERSRNYYNRNMERKIVSFESIKNAKADLRKAVKLELSAFVKDKESFERKSSLAAAHFVNSGFYKSASLVLCFVSLKNEIDTTQIITRCLHDGKPVAVPKVLKNGRMAFYRLQNAPLDSQLEIGAFGILEPKKNLKRLWPIFLPAETVIVLPGLAFSKAGERLGKGKGFYDKFLSFAQILSFKFRFSAKKIGLCFDFQIKDKIPCDKHDKTVDALVTENGMFLVT